MTTLGVILAAVLTVNFEIPPQDFREPVVVQGLRFSVQCRGAIKFKSWYSSHYLGIDNSNDCGDGPSPSAIMLSGDVYIDHHSEPFNFHGLIGVAHEPNLEGFHVRSSNGDEVISQWGRLDVFWPSVNWELVTNMGDSFHKGHGYDDVRYSVEVVEPGTAILTGIAGLLLFGFSRKMKWQ
jgi:hypothetical protein